VSLRLALASLPLPAWARRWGLRELARRTARAFGAKAPDVAGPFPAALRRYAAFTREQADRALADAARTPVARARLRAEAFDLGAALRRRLGVRSRADAMRAARLVYRIVDVEFQGDADGEIRVARCAFSALYAPTTCDLISAFDEGLLAGLAGEGRLHFSRRISEGAGWCAATFTVATGPA
jgi:hypothetical protein